MSDPLLAAATCFFSIIAVGTLLVVIHDWLEERLGAPRTDRARAARQQVASRGVVVN